ncbi:hypothetical protein P154DRAFT_204140 [Amniculicola lignicola CBS 123094]|uniref:Cora-domain-containing protein n=1 Tax=Amniculicola lignicola CBS 123094 TaxID=1392246 RepID=A0A6A5WF12_9PLEO|nr:hypothetical protein P154DRAFT_204140 [Amniculicola lignicola CBS 123094]
MALYDLAPYNRLASLDATPPLQLHYYEVWEDEKDTCMRTGAIGLDNVDDWLNLADEFAIKSRENIDIPEASMRLRLIAFKRRNLFTIACGEHVFNSISQSFRLHSTSAPAITNNNGSFARYFTEFSDVKKISKLDMVFKMPNCFNVGYDALSISYDIRSECTRALLHGVSDEEFQWLLTYFKTQKQKVLYRNPLAIAAGMLWSHRLRTEAYRARLDDIVHKIEISMGHAIPGVPPDSHLRSAYEALMIDSLDFGNIIKELHSCQTELVGLRHVGDFGRDLGQFLCKIGTELQEIRSSTEAPRVNTDPIVHQIEFSTNLYVTLTSQVTTLKERVQNHINLTYTLIAQDENRISRSVAEETALIAVATKRDRAAMKTIAVLTIIFLPPTFVATFPSMPMLNWNPQLHGKFTSNYFWVYWAVAVPLTTFVLIIWSIWWRRENKSYQYDLDEAKRAVSPTSSGVSLNSGRHGLSFHRNASFGSQPTPFRNSI